MARRNFLVMQSGGPTAVLNRSLYGLVSEASRRGANEIYGALHGIEGLLSGELVDLTRISRAGWTRIARTPGAALGSTRRNLRDEDRPRLLRALQDYGIGYCHIIGGNDSAETGHRVVNMARKAGLDLAVVNVPKTIDNDLALTDHCPGYGSAARFVALATMGAGKDAEAMSTTSAGTIIEVMGRDAGWLAAASALGKRDERDPPHVVGLPEAPLDVERFFGRMEEAHRRFGFAVAVVAENARSTDGVIGGHRQPAYVDEFGHEYFQGPAGHLAKELARRLNKRVRHEVPGTIQRSMTAIASETDRREADMVGRAAINYALAGETDRMVTLVRSGGDEYRCETGLAPLPEVAGRVRKLPPDYFEGSSGLPTQAFLDYARPLIGRSLPRFERVR